MNERLSDIKKGEGGEGRNKRVCSFGLNDELRKKITAISSRKTTFAKRHSAYSTACQMNDKTSWKKYKWNEETGGRVEGEN